MHGVITQFDEARSFGLISVSRSARNIFYHLHACRLDSIGRQYPRARNVGTQVEFTVVAGNRAGRDAAMDVFVYEPFADPIDLGSHRELSTLVRWIPEQGVGYAQRESNDWIRVAAENVITEGSLKIGSQIWHAISFREYDGAIFDPNLPLKFPVDPKNVVEATMIEICMPEAAESMIEPVAQKVDVVTASILLSEKFRRTPLRRLGIRPVSSRT
ncbi:MAG: hypothetical protein ACRDHZ_25550 [Ktedonobacteraceae bacterium]